MNKISIKLEPKGYIHPELHGQFTEHLGKCVYGGIWVGKDSDIPNYDGLRKDLVDALAVIKPPVIRWPGGCFADTYHWRDGIGPVENRPVIKNSNGGYDSNEFGTHEFMRFCRMVGAEPWLSVNVLDGSLKEAKEWLMYCNDKAPSTIALERAKNGDSEPFNVKYWGIGNEVWNCGGKYTPEAYCQEYRKYSTAFDGFTSFEDRMNGDVHPLVKVAVGPCGIMFDKGNEWTERFFKYSYDFGKVPVDAYDIHLYNHGSKTGRHPAKITGFPEDEWYTMIQGVYECEEFILKQWKLVDRLQRESPAGGFSPVDTTCELFVGEWGNWYQIQDWALFQQNSMRDAVCAALTLDMFHKNCDKIRLATLAQMVNVIQSLILTDGKTTICTPTYRVFEMYVPHRGGQKLDCDIDSDIVYSNDHYSITGIHAFASEKGGIVTLSVVNADMLHSHTAEVAFDGASAFVSAKVLAGDTPDAINTAENPDNVCIREGSAPVQENGKWIIEAPAASVNVYTFALPSALEGGKSAERLGNVNTVENMWCVPAKVTE